jgi:alkanesulfonate monooxygenase SsuD/methylene tetrahydromethanopterin reductase-like flavin-dependent oxidoreductase (luciferase family)
MTVRFSTRCPNSDYLGFETSPEAIVAAAKKAEEVGFDAIFVNDHIIGNSGSHATRRWREMDRTIGSPS